MSQTEIKLLKPLKHFASHPAFLFRANTRMRIHMHTLSRRHTNTLSHPSSSLNHHQFLPHLLQPLFTPPPVSFPLRSIYYFTSLPSSLLLSILLRDDTPFSYHTSLSPFSISFSFVPCRYLLLPS